jgi:DNA-directed RNA polymerase, subunit A' (EC 2.7.7.6)
MEETEYVIKEIKFGILSPEHIKKLSVVTITVPDTYDEEWVPISFGLMDRRLGTLEPLQRCETCGERMEQCPGHFGKIDLARPVIHIGFIKFITLMLQATCSECGRILLDQNWINKYRSYYEKFKAKKLHHFANLISNMAIKRASQATKCPHCKADKYKIKFERPFSIIEEINGESKILTPYEIHDRLKKIPNEDVELMGFDPIYARPEWAILFNLPVPPISIRPSITLETGERSEDDLTHKLGDIVRTNEKLKQSIESGSPQLIIDEHWNLLQFHVATYFDNEIAGLSQSVHRSGRPLKTFAQRLKGKEGRFRSNLSGKRVDFSARTVISPDPFISINEVGVPYEIAMRLTIPEKVTQWNIDLLKEAVRKGPNELGGANYVIRPDGRQIDLRFVKDRNVLADQLAPGYIVERHLKDGDLVIFNRQPSLHRISIMAHQVKCLPGRTLRINPMVCPPYNADFDGDEMNLFVPQDSEARSEMEVIMKVEKQMLTPRYGGMIIGALHDYITAAFLLTKKDTRLSRFISSFILGYADYNGPIEKSENILGREIFSKILPKINYEGKPLAVFEEEDKKLVIKDGKLISGVIDHNAIGDQKSHTLLHRIYLTLGPEFTREFIDRLGKLLIAYLDHYGFTIGLDEEDLPEEVYEEIDQIIKNHLKKVDEYIEMYNKGLLEREPGATVEETLEQKIMDELNIARDEAGKIAEKYFSQNNSILITSKTGARGKMLNLFHMAVCIGQQSLRGKRINRGYEARTLAHFKKGDISPFARGFIKSNYKKGLSPIEFFFHAVSGREGLVDTAVRTSQSGYMQRRLINALLDIHVEYDGTVRDSEGNIIQFLYGEDGIDPTYSYGQEPIDLDSIIKEELEK